MHGEKVHDVGVCGEGECCRVRIANMDLVQFCFVPTINRLISEVHCCISNQHFHQGLHISIIFLMGAFIFCRLRRDYQFLENKLLTDLQKMNFTHSNNVGLCYQIGNIQVNKVEVERLNDDDEDRCGKDQNSIANIALEGSVLHCINTNNRLVERFATKSYTITLEIRVYGGSVLNDKNNIFDSNGFPDNSENDPIENANSVDIDNNSISELEHATNMESIDCEDSICSFYERMTYDICGVRPSAPGTYAICNQLNSQTKVQSNMQIPIVKKGLSLASLAPSDGEISASFTVFKYSEGVRFRVGKQASR